MSKTNIKQPVNPAGAKAQPDALQQPGSASPTPLEFEVCRQVLRWLRDQSGLDYSWHDPLTEIAGVVRGCKVIAEQQKEESARDEWMESLAKTCRADDKPCEGCQQGGVCDGSPNDKVSGQSGRERTPDSQ